MLLIYWDNMCIITGDKIVHYPRCTKTLKKTEGCGIVAKLEMNLLSQHEIEKLLQQTYSLLQETGVAVLHEDARKMMKKAGCQVEAEVVRIPQKLIAWALHTAPSCIEIYDRAGNRAMSLAGKNTYFGPGPTCPNFFDPWTGERRTARKQDAADTAKVCQALPNIDFVMSLCCIGDVDPGRADVHEMDAMLRNTTKPIMGWAFGAAGLQKIIDLCAAAAGGIKNLSAKPFLMVYAEPITPFVHPEESVKKLELLARNRIPVIYSPGMILGATCPVTIAGALTVGLADALAGLVISQLICEGTPFISSAPAGPMDMRTMNHAYGAPEAELMNIAACQLFHAIGIPVFAAAGATDSKVSCDGQSAAESMMQIIGAFGAGGNLTHDVGFMDCGLTGSLASLVMCDELIGMARRFMDGILVDEDHLAKEAIQDVDIGGSYIAEPHTAEFFREELWFPRLMERGSYESWRGAGARDMRAVCEDRVREILRMPNAHPLPDDVLRRMDEIMAG